MKRTMMGVDLAKNVFEVYVEDESGQVVKRHRLSRKKMLPWFANALRRWWGWKPVAARIIGGAS